LEITENVHVRDFRKGHRNGNWRKLRRVEKALYHASLWLLNKGEGIFAWAPSLREWLKDQDYVFWLGAGGLRIGR